MKCNYKSNPNSNYFAREYDRHLQFKFSYGGNRDSET